MAAVYAAYAVSSEPAKKVPLFTLSLLARLALTIPQTGPPGRPIQSER